MSINKILSLVFGILFSFHALQLFSSQGDNDYLFVPLLSPLLSLISGVLLLILPLMSRDQWILLSFVISRSLIGVVVGFFLHKSELFYLLGGGNYLVYQFFVDNIAKTWSWLLFIAVILFSINYLRILKNVSPESNFSIIKTILMIVIMTVIVFAVLFFGLGLMMGVWWSGKSWL